jgi:hypothetical protein
MWCLSCIRDCSFYKMVLIHRMNTSCPFSFNGYAPRHTLVTYSWISSYNWALDQVLAWGCPFIVDFSYLELWREMFHPTTLIFFFEGIVGATSLNPILIPLVQSLGDLSLERVLSILFSDIVHSCLSHLNLTALHHLIFALHHTMCITSTPSHKDRITSAF